MHSYTLYYIDVMNMLDDNGSGWMQSEMNLRSILKFITKDDGFSILLSNCNSSLKLLESIFIHIVKPSLDGSQYSIPLNILS